MQLVSKGGLSDLVIDNRCFGISGCRVTWSKSVAKRSLGMLVHCVVQVCCHQNLLWHAGR
jgi:hypothetical protein